MKIAPSHSAEAHWYVIDAAGKILGRLASQVAARLRGKSSPLFKPYALPAEHIIILNAAQIVLTGSRKIYQHYTGYPGGLKTQRFEDLLAKYPERIIEKAIKGMLPKNKLGREAFRRLKVYADATHPHIAQQPQLLTIH
jgi:large subunit ribosomal protein L13